LIIIEYENPARERVERVKIGRRLEEEEEKLNKRKRVVRNCFFNVIEML